MSSRRHMAEHSKAQRAALLRVEQLSAQLQSHCQLRMQGGHPAYSLDDIAKTFDAASKEISGLDREYDLGSSVLEEFRTRMIAAIYEEAGKRSEHTWQARFAKKHGI